MQDQWYMVPLPLPLAVSRPVPLAPEPEPAPLTDQLRDRVIVILFNGEVEHSLAVLPSQQPNCGPVIRPCCRILCVKVPHTHTCRHSMTTASRSGRSNTQQSQHSAAGCGPGNNNPDYGNCASTQSCSLLLLGAFPATSLVGQPRAQLPCCSAG